MKKVSPVSECERKNIEWRSEMNAGRAQLIDNQYHTLVAQSGKKRVERCKNTLCDAGERSRRFFIIIASSAAPLDDSAPDAEGRSVVIMNTSFNIPSSAINIALRLIKRGVIIFLRTYEDEKILHRFHLSLAPSISPLSAWLRYEAVIKNQQRAGL